MPSTLRGRIISRSGVPLSEAEIRVIGDSISIVTDSTGTFHLRRIEPGLTVLQVRRIGYNAQYLQVTLVPGDVRMTDIMLEPGAFVLPEIEVRAEAAKPIEYAWTTKYDDFFRRQRLGLPGGTFFTREDIRHQSVMRTAEILSRVPGTRVRFYAPGSLEIDFSRCSSGHVGVWVNGRKVNWQAEHQQTGGISLEAMRRPPTQQEQDRARQHRTRLADVLDAVHPLEIEFMEVYRGIGSIPGEYSDAGCGAIIIWTK